MPAWRFGPFLLDTEQQSLLRDAEPVSAQPMVFDALVLFVERAGELVTHEQLRERLWPDTHVTEASMFQVVRKLRKLLGPQRDWLHTVPRRGYRFHAACEPAGPDLALPKPATPFFGRQHELRRALQAVAEHHLVTLIGPAGAGKTRLAIEVAKQTLLPTAYVELVAARTVADVRATLAGGLDAWPPKPGDRRLVVLDNAETSLDAVAELVPTLMAAAPSLRVLCTSRAALRLSAECVVEVGPLLPDDARALLAERLRAAAVPPPSEEAAARVLAAVDRLPLGITLAAAAARVRGLGDVADRLQAGHTLPSGPRDLPERHRSLEHAVEWSWQCLSEQARAVATCLGAFAAGFDEEQADHVADTASAPTIDQLVRSSLAWVDHRFDPPRYQLYEMARVRAARALAASGAHREVWERHAYIVGATFVSRGARADLGRMLRRRAERPELVAAWQRFRHVDPTRAAVAVERLCYAYWLTQEHDARLELARDAVEVFAAGGPTAHYAAALHHLSGAAAAASLDDLHTRTLAEELRVARKLGDPTTLNRALLDSAKHAHYTLSQLDRAAAYLREMEAVPQQPAALWDLHMHDELGTIASARGDAAAAARHFHRARQQARERKLVQMEARVLEHQALAAEQGGRLDEALVRLEEVLAVLGEPQERPEFWLLATTNLARLELLEGDLGRARSWLDQARACDTGAYPENQAFRLCCEGDWALLAGEVDGAASAWEAARRRLTSPDQQHWLHGRVAMVWALAGDAKGVRRTLARAGHSRASWARAELHPWAVAALAIVGSRAAAVARADAALGDLPAHERRARAIVWSLKVHLTGGSAARSAEDALGAANDDLRPLVAALRTGEPPHGPGLWAYLHQQISAALPDQDRAVSTRASTNTRTFGGG